MVSSDSGETPHGTSFTIRVVDSLIAVTLAPRCAACASVLDRPGDGPVCANCWSSIRPIAPPLCRTCGDPLPSWRTISLVMERCAACRRRPRPLDAGRAAGEYEGALRHIIHAFKYERRRRLAPRLGELLRAAGHDLLTGADCVIPVPLHPWRRVRRGFNQACDLAATLGPPVVRALWRTRATPAQTGLTAAGRRKNMRGAFRLSPLLSGRTLRTMLANRIVVLVDDVRTTGATLDACALALKQAGVREVRALTVARAALRQSRTPRRM